MKRRVIGLVAIVVALAWPPLPAHAGACYSITGFPSPVLLDLDVFGKGLLQGTYYSIGAIMYGWCGPATQPAAMIGGAWVMPNNSVGFAMSINVARNGCVPGTIEGTLDASNGFRSGVAQSRGAGNTPFNLTLQAAICPTF